MRKFKFLYSLFLTISLISCEKNEITSNYSKGEILFEKIYNDINNVPQRIEINDNNDIFLYYGSHIIKLDAYGNKLWSLECNNSDIIPTKDGGCIAIYSKYISISYETIYYLAKINSTGNIEWEKSGPNYQLSQITIGENEEIYGVGDIANNGTPSYITKPRFFKYSKNGDLIFSKSLIDSNDNIPYQTQHMVKLRNNKFIISTFNSISFERTNYDFNIIEFDIDANSISEKHFGGYKDEFLFSIYETSDDGLILTGCSNSKDGDVKSFRNELTLEGANGWVVKLDKNREIEWEKTLGGNTSSSTYFHKSIHLNNTYLIGFSTEATDGDFKGTERPKSGYITFDESGKMLNVKYIGAWSVDFGFNSMGEILILSSNVDQYYDIYNPKLIKMR